MSHAAKWSNLTSGRIGGVYIFKIPPLLSHAICSASNNNNISAVVCQLESSGKWPEEVDAIRKVKVAFYIHMAKTLEEHSGLVASPTNTYLDILKVSQTLAWLIYLSLNKWYFNDLAAQASYAFNVNIGCEKWYKKWPYTYHHIFYVHLPRRDCSII